MIDFPNSPTVGQQFVAPNGTFVWDGTKWAPVLKTAGGGAAVAIQGGFKNLQISVPSVSTVTVTADQVITYDGTVFYDIANVNSTINAATVGANGLDAGAIAAASWYAVWVISGTGGQAALLSLSATAPTMPAGYTAKARVGWVRTAPSTTNILKTLQYGRKAQYVTTGSAPNVTLPLITNAVSGTFNDTTYTPVAVAIGAFVPPTAGVIRLQFCSAGGFYAAVSPNPNYSGFTTANPPPIASRGGSSYTQVVSPADFVLESTNIYWAGGSATYDNLYCFGWEDNL